MRHRYQAPVGWFQESRSGAGAASGSFVNSPTPAAPPKRAKTSHSASLGSRAGFPILDDTHAVYDAASFQLTCITGTSPRARYRTSSDDPKGALQHAPFCFSHRVPCKYPPPSVLFSFGDIARVRYKLGKFIAGRQEFFNQYFIYMNGMSGKRAGNEFLFDRGVSYHSVGRFEVIMR